MSRRQPSKLTGICLNLWSLLSQSLDDLGTTRGECLGRTRWSSLLDFTTYLYYFYKWLYTTSPWSHVLLEYSTITWPHHVTWLCKFPHYLYLLCVVCLNVCDQVFEHVGNLFLLRALITVMYFGMCNSPATFQLMMDTLFHELIIAGKIVIYMDDILIFISLYLKNVMTWQNG